MHLTNYCIKFLNTADALNALRLIDYCMMFIYTIQMRLTYYCMRFIYTIQMRLTYFCMMSINITDKFDRLLYVYSHYRCV